jgi:general secretion pathway protein C
MKRRLPSIINFLLLLALSGVVTYWALQFSARRTPAEAAVPVAANDRRARTQPLDTGGIAALFGAGSGAPGSASRVRLAGVIAEGPEGTGVALLSLDGQPATAYRAGDPVDGQMVLAEVHADRVVLQTPAGPQDIKLPERPVSDGISPVR